MDATQRVKEINAAYRAKVERLRTDTDYTQQYKATRMAAAYLAARDEMAQVKAVHEHAVRTDRTRAERALFGLGEQASGSEVISYRDATDRPGQLPGRGRGDDRAAPRSDER
jgi:hypothetical protein